MPLDDEDACEICREQEAEYAYVPSGDDARYGVAVCVSCGEQLDDELSGGSTLPDAVVALTAHADGLW